MGAPDQYVLTCRGLSKTFRVGRRSTEALRDLTIQVARGKVTGLIGPDGAGKTTLMRLAAGLLRPDTGSIVVLGLDASRQSLRVQASVGYMPQRFGLYEDLTVQENLELYADLQGVSVASRSVRYQELMQMTGLAPFMRRLAGRLSGGMKQKLGLACTLIHPPRLLLLDEPTVGVDPVSRRELWQIVARFVREEGTTVLLSTAYLDEAEACDEVIILDEGSFLGQGRPSEFSQTLTGRTFKARSAGTRKNRDLQEACSSQADVIDAVIQGDAVRLVLQPDADSRRDSMLADLKDVSMVPVPPRFEDSFVAMLRARRIADGAAFDSSASGDEDDLTVDAPDGNGGERGRELVRQAGAVGKPGRLVEVHDLQRRFGDFHAVKGISFDITRGEVFGLLGANGAGKTTTFRMLCGLLPASGGTLRVAGVDVRRAAATARARIGYMSHKFSLYGTLSVGDNLRFFSSAYGLARRRRRERIAWAVAEFQLGSVVNSNSGELPLGYKQRLALACALMHEPEMIFLDEPTSGVDPLARREFWHRINVLAARGVTVMVTTHFMEEAEYCDRMAIMMDGRILALGTPEGIKQQSRSPDNPEPTMEDAFIKLIETESVQT